MREKHVFMVHLSKIRLESINRVRFVFNRAWNYPVLPKTGSIPNQSGLVLVKLTGMQMKAAHQ